MKGKRLVIIVLFIISMSICLGLLLMQRRILTTSPILHAQKKEKISNTSKSWRDDFTKLDATFWNVANNKALEGRYTNVHQGYFAKDHVWIKNGYLILKLTQQEGSVGTNPKGVISKGGEIESFKTFGYGTYEWRMRMSSTSDDPTKGGEAVSGQVSAGFTFINNSENEIDFEVEGQHPHQVEMTVWKNPDTSQFPTSDDRTYTFKNVPGASTNFHTYTFIWKPKEITYFIDGKLAAQHLEHIPEVPAHFMINHWGTNSNEFGGTATIGTNRYMLIDWVRYTPLHS
jgi:endo-1,3-1,4-beta-glycanase ExoK